MAGGSKIVRCHGPFVSDEEVEEIVNHLKAYGEPDYVSGVVEGPSDDQEGNIDAVLGLGGNTDSEDAQYDTAVAIVAKDRKCSTSYIQRKLGIGYNKAARLVEQMEDAGLVSPANHVGKRETRLFASREGPDGLFGPITTKIKTPQEIEDLLIPRGGREPLQVQKGAGIEVKHLELLLVKIADLQVRALGTLTRHELELAGQAFE